MSKNPVETCFCEKNFVYSLAQRLRNKPYIGFRTQCMIKTLGKQRMRGWGRGGALSLMTVQNSEKILNFKNEFQKMAYMLKLPSLCPTRAYIGKLSEKNYPSVICSYK